ncbi:hypothetical protein G6F46_009190 [Rhizopus delemar]|uniref:BHLH domain-containing protein n=3 Tax=Rhizopus TaxID=4842 RepID=I1C477_RHIO9|nr:hypothetical protein RO3G_07962 [Rhizopus delemar RA 99-880]KAG1039537.1 hypothetical protein G6F43_012481 [Rhizopus delemar]KAG1543516.1 hypothetical protein G6F51_006625 [Rhizopus arrhizus]KAG1453412.1 hypothetical protein G6F55_008153 [Rhizopus delemar]KAG1497294.1 hypothetical protein G6F54_005866 [Rhizopus delemar]|eukprot:EIE83257.1 hypothetical protein RO3G_07962 [Rhizopus delemar RA 99-880]
MSLTQQGQSTFMNALLIPEDNTNEDSGYQQQQSKKRSLDSAEVADKESPTPKKERKPRKAPHELLTDAEKKANHIASEKKRRQNIRLGFDQLIEIVPSLTQGNRSEAFILQKSVDHIRHLVSVKNDLKSQIRDLQNMLGESNFDEDSSEDDLTYSSF